VVTQRQTNPEIEAVAAQLRDALDPLKLDALGALLDDNVRWGGGEDTPDTCHTRADVVNRLQRQRQDGLETTLLELAPGEYGILVALKVRQPARPDHDHDHEWTVYQTLKVHDQHIVDIRPYPNRYSAAVSAGVAVDPASGTLVEGVTPILNVSSVVDSIAWFARLGWSKTFDWRGDDGRVGFGGVRSGNSEIFLCRDGQGGRGEHGAWLSIWVADVDAVHATCDREGITVLKAPRDEPWGVREMLIHHPDGHTFRIGQPSQSGH
jgi:catechol 2,3-dioxygenase-like lactoylglutathione lyase family enzyme